MKTLLSILLCAVSIVTSRAADRYLYATPISNLVECVTVLSVANDGTNIVQLRLTNWLTAAQVFAMTQTLHAAISPVIAYSLHNTNPVITLDSGTNALTASPYYGLKLRNLSNDFSYISFFDSLGSNGYSLRAISQGTNGSIDLFDHFNQVTAWSYNGADFRMYRMLAADYVTGDTVTIWNSDKRATNSVTTAAELALLSGVTTAVKFGMTPIASITAWAKNLTGAPSLPAGWVECNGQTLSDADSPLNGVVIPNLNNSGGSSTNAFLRGHTASGAWGGSDTHSHGFNSTVNVDLGAAEFVPENSGGTTSATNLPPFYHVVWIMRVK